LGGWIRETEWGRNGFLGLIGGSDWRWIGWMDWRAPRIGETDWRDGVEGCRGAVKSKGGLDYICIWLGSDGCVVLVDCNDK
jgi:hypothetical protein